MANTGHGGNIKEIARKKGIDYNNIIDFSSNINPLGMSSKVKRAIIDSMEEIKKYPDISYMELKKSISEYENINESYLMLGNGAAEVLFNIVKALKPKKVLIPVPTFSEYKEAVECVNSKVELYKMSENNSFKICEDILDKITEEIDLIFICNPNNPTGVLTNRELLMKILIKSKENNSTVLIDESFMDFITEDISMVSTIETFDNLIILKSLTKFFAMPGLRIGYGVCSNKDFISEVYKITPAWNINILADVATRVSLHDKNYMRKTIQYMEKEKAFLYNSLKTFKNLNVYEPSVNFIFFKSNLDINLKSELLKYNVLIRSCSNYDGLNEYYYRVAVKSREDNAKLICCIKNILGDNE
ncbi:MULTISPECIES: threonine-phosphate decarboxylase CobD [Clostridium]|uniref:threonine-phosphate decarboxylase CobD n=1 Tax=Clostridium TaxID=1485 RepID=UPI000CF5E4BF|nr:MULTISPECIES: threonine-phosphate decarboxylase CobD [Clostridium]MBN1046354.1 threonine-phosphate decarboxylase [Clostridium botulinum]NFR86370.1 threonine-phosphate decarboxylase [Clostridium botulinum]NFR91709.1 threonine-phosphate decarboxylase [Clostridium botulinum]NFT07040.1 threonine-phosphate decarboxylase [Clostridium botulinum]NFU00223.1 threonine-phosphate decarboxylase [Clostridium botulinum]